MRSPLSKDITGVAVLLIVFAVVAVFLATNDSGGGRLVAIETGSDPSIYNDRGTGTRAFFDLTKKLGFQSVVERQNWSQLPTNARILICAAPETVPATAALGAGNLDSRDTGAIDGEDAAGVRAWLAEGRTLLLMADNLPSPKLATSGAATPAPTTTLAGGEFGDAFGIGVAAALRSSRFMSYAPMQPMAIMRGVSAVKLHGGARVTRYMNDEIELFGSAPSASGHGPAKGEPAGILFPVGRGRVIVIADGNFACNNNLGRADNAAFLSNVLTTYAAPGDRVLFDEYHHGDIESSHTIWTAVGPGVQRAAIQLLFAAIVIGLVLGSRFGSAAPPAMRERRTSGEYVTSLAGLYRNARATAPALEVIYRQFLRDVCARLALPPDVSLEQLADAAARRGNLNKVDLRKLLGRCERLLDQQTLTEHELLDLVKHMERFRKELGID